ATHFSAAASAGATFAGGAAPCACPAHRHAPQTASRLGRAAARRRIAARGRALPLHRSESCPGAWPPRPTALAPPPPLPGLHPSAAVFAVTLAHAPLLMSVPFSSHRFRKSLAA